MEEFPGNSHQSKRRPEEPTEKKIEKVVQGEVIERKKSRFRRFRDSFFAGRADVVVESVVWDVLIPAAKDTVSDAALSFVDSMLYDRFGVSRSPSRRVLAPRGGGRGSFNGNHTNYQAPGSRLVDRIGEPHSRAISLPRNRGFDLDDIILATRFEAEEVIDGLFQSILKYNAVTVSDLYGFLGKNAPFTADNYGWTDIRGARVQHVHDGYLLVLPRPEPLD